MQAVVASAGAFRSERDERTLRSSGRAGGRKGKTEVRGTRARATSGTDGEGRTVRDGARRREGRTPTDGPSSRNEQR